MEPVHPLPLAAISETHVLRMLSQGAPVTGVLNELCNFIDAKSPGVIPTVLLLNSNGTHLEAAAALKVPKEWKKEFDGLKVPSSARLQRAAESPENPFPVADIRSDPSFAPCWDLVLSQGIQAAWAAPILSKSRKILGSLILFYPTPHSLNARELELIERVIHMAAIAIECHLNEEERRKVSRQLHQSQDEERRRIARELHDSTGQKLALLAINLSMIKDTTPAKSRDEILSECASLTGSISDELRTLSYLLHPPLLDDCGLELAIKWYVSGINQRQGPRVEAEITQDLRRLTEDAELALFRVVQASLTNVHLHSKASEAIVRIEQNADGVIVTVSDNGRGIPDGVLDYSSQTKTAGVGIAGMRERMKHLGGCLEIKTSRSGTKVKARVPKSHFRAALTMSA
ncbi:MAG: GAF domain-containing sensor histidine kinase [Candidatus Acidiferrales bacterium]